MRDQQYSCRRKCSKGQLGNRRSNLYEAIKNNLRSRVHKKYDVDMRAVNTIKAESSSLVKAGDWSCIPEILPSVFHNYSYVLSDDQQYSQQMQFNYFILHHTSPTGFQYCLVGNHRYYLYWMHNVPNVVLCGNPYHICNVLNENLCGNFYQNCLSKYFLFTSCKYN